MSKSGVSNVRPAGWIRPTNWVFSRPRDDFAKYKNERQFFNQRNRCSKCVHLMFYYCFCYANKLNATCLMLPSLPQNVSVETEVQSAECSKNTNKVKERKQLELVVIFTL